MVAAEWSGRPSESKPPTDAMGHQFFCVDLFSAFALFRGDKIGKVLND